MANKHCAELVLSLYPLLFHTVNSYNKDNILPIKANIHLTHLKVNKNLNVLAAPKHIENIRLNNRNFCLKEILQIFQINDIPIITRKSGNIFT